MQGKVKSQKISARSREKSREKYKVKRKVKRKIKRKTLGAAQTRKGILPLTHYFRNCVYAVSGDGIGNGWGNFKFYGREIQFLEVGIEVENEYWISKIELGVGGWGWG